jgi:hypothetical protein
MLLWVCIHTGQAWKIWIYNLWILAHTFGCTLRVTSQTYSPEYTTPTQKNRYLLFLSPLSSSMNKVTFIQESGYLIPTTYCSVLISISVFSVGPRRPSLSKNANVGPTSVTIFWGAPGQTKTPILGYKVRVLNCGWHNGSYLCLSYLWPSYNSWNMSHHNFISVTWEKSASSLQTHEILSDYSWFPFVIPPG